MPTPPRRPAAGKAPAVSRRDQPRKQAPPKQVPPKRASPKRASPKQAPRASKVAAPAEREGAADWRLALIDERAVHTMIKARKLGLPLEQAADMANVIPELAQLWLSEGRRMEQFGGRPSPVPYRQACLDFARAWDAAPVGLIVKLRSYMLRHAEKDPRTCAQLLTAIEHEYAARHARRPPLTPEREAAIGLLAAEAAGPDLGETYAPLELPDLRPGAAGRTARLTHTAPDGSTTTAELAEGQGAFADRTDAELEHYAAHGTWPDPGRPQPDLEALDTEGEEMLADPALEAALARELAGKAPEDAVPLPPTAAPPRPTAQAAIGARLEPHGPLRELPGREVVERVAVGAPAPTPAAAPPDAPPLRRIDPLWGR